MDSKSSFGGGVGIDGVFERRLIQQLGLVSGRFSHQLLESADADIKNAISYWQRGSKKRFDGLRPYDESKSYTVAGYEVIIDR